MDLHPCESRYFMEEVEKNYLKGKITGLGNFLPMIFYLLTTDLPIRFLSFSVYYRVNLEDDFTQAHQHYDNVGGKYPSR